MRIRTVREDILSEELGFCDCHCHPMICSKHLYNYDSNLFDVKDYDKSLMELQDFFLAGGASIIDASPFGTGRATQWFEKLSIESGVHIIASTGFHMRWLYPKNHWIFTASIDEMALRFIEEIETGMYVECENLQSIKHIGPKAGIIKTASSNLILDDIDKAHYLAAIYAHLETGAPLLCHTEGNALTVVDFLTAHGVKPQSIVVAHMESCNENTERYDEEVAKRGVYIEYDKFLHLTSDEVDWEMKRIYSILNKGYGNQVVLGSDPTRDCLYRYSGGYGLKILPGQYCKILLDYGISKAQIKMMTVVNPARMLSFI